MGFIERKVRKTLTRMIESGELRFIVARIVRSVGKDVLAELLADEEDIARKSDEYIRRVFTGQIDPSHCILGFADHEPDDDPYHGVVSCARCGKVIPVPEAPVSAGGPDPE